MSVLIKGMEMPKCCAECPLNHDAECKYYPYNRLICDEPYTQRGDWCPLIEVQPHGRLIDEHWIKDAMITTLEALKKNPKMDKQEMHLIAAFDTLRVMLEDAPTIIEEET